MPHHPPLKSTPHLFCGTTQQGPVATGPYHPMPPNRLMPDATQPINAPPHPQGNVKSTATLS